MAETTQDLYIGPVQNQLLYSFYNSITAKITITGKIVLDNRGIYTKIKANPDDLELRNYFLKSSLVKASKSDQYKPQTPDLMNVQEVAEYIRVKPKTVYNWVNAEKIPVTKVGGRSKFRKAEMDKWLDERTKPGAKKHVSRRRSG